MSRNEYQNLQTPSPIYESSRTAPFYHLISVPTAAPEPCEEGEFQCDNGKCLRESLKCDYVEQCEYGEDEDDTLCDRGKRTISILYRHGIADRNHVRIRVVTFQ